MKPVYVVTMYRWGDRDCHSYILGVFTKKAKAEKAALAEKEYRGGKYYPEVLEMVPDSNTWSDDTTKVIMGLERNPSHNSRGALGPGEEMRCH